MAASASSKAALESLYATVRKDVEDQLAERIAELDRREKALDKRERALEGREFSREHAVAISEAAVVQEISSIAVGGDDTASTYTDGKSVTPTGSLKDKLFGRDRASSPEKGLAGAPAGSGRGAQWWARQKDHTKSLMNKSFGGRFSTASVDEEALGNTDNTDSVQDSQTQEEHALLERPPPVASDVQEELQRTLLQKAPPAKKSLFEKKTSLFDDDEPEVAKPPRENAEGTGFKGIDGPVGLSGPGSAPIPKNNVSPPKSLFANRAPPPSLPKDLVNLLGEDDKVDKFADSPRTVDAADPGAASQLQNKFERRSNTAETTVPKVKSPINALPSAAATNQFATGKKTSESAASGSNINVGDPPVRSGLFGDVVGNNEAGKTKSDSDGSNPGKTPSEVAASGSSINVGGQPVKSGLFGSVVVGKNEVGKTKTDIDGSNPGSASELRAKLEGRKNSGGAAAVVKQKSTPSAGFKVPPPRKSFADLP